MQRRDFFKNGSLAFLGTALLNPISGKTTSILDSSLKGKTAKNIIFMVSDGMSIGTLQLADTFKYRKEGKHSNWVQLLQDPVTRRALMDTASNNSIVTDSAAASSSWGGGKRVNNGALNVNPDGSYNKPILQKFKAKGKSVGCVTSVPITHATPAGFCVNNNRRGDMDEIAADYLKLRFDVMMGGGVDVFSANKRKDKRDLFTEFKNAGFAVARNRKEMLAINKLNNKPVLGIFHADSLPYSVDRNSDNQLIDNTPTLAEMTKTAIDQLSKNKNGFVMQVEGGKIDWAAHANDAAALIYEQLAFDDAVKVAMDFARSNKDTLLIVTTDHGNANPGIFSGKNTDKHFDSLQFYKHSNDWILMGINNKNTVDQVRERIEAAQGIGITKEEAKLILDHYNKLDDEGLYNSYKLPFKDLSVVLGNYNAIGFGSMSHSGDYVELTAYGPGSELITPFVKNYEMHNIMLTAAGVLA